MEHLPDEHMKSLDENYKADAVVSITKLEQVLCEDVSRIANRMELRGQDFREAKSIRLLVKGFLHYKAEFNKLQQQKKEEPNENT